MKTFVIWIRLNLTTKERRPVCTNCIFQSPSTNVDNPRDDELRDLIASTDKLPIQFYLHWGKYDTRDTHGGLNRASVNAALFKQLQDKGYVVHSGSLTRGTVTSVGAFATTIFCRRFFQFKKPRCKLTPRMNADGRNLTIKSLNFMEAL
jgi:hypothetical protein